MIFLENKTDICRGFGMRFAVSGLFIRALGFKLLLYPLRRADYKLAVRFLHLCGQAEGRQYRR
jgi:hypothetical protein